MRVNKELPGALLAGKEGLSNEARVSIRSLSGAKPWRFLSAALSTWAGIIIAIMVATWIPVATLPALIIIATRFNVFGLLIHEQTHFLGFKGKYGDWIADALVAYPLLGITVKDYAKVHLAHHKHYFTDSDPDHLRKSGVDWAFPMTRLHILKLILSDITGMSFLKLLKGKKRRDTGLFNRPNPTPTWLRVLVILAAVGAITYMSAWGGFLIFWVVPLTMILPLIVRLGAVCEHVYNLPGSGIIESSPLIIPKWWESLLLPNLNFTFHAYHHFYPGVAWINLPKVHEIFKREGLVNERNVFYGYMAYLKYLQRG